MPGYIFVLLMVLTIVNGDKICNDLKNGETVPHETDCDKFYVCNFKEAQLKSCSFELHFNPVKKYCQSKSTAGCDSTITTPKPDPTTPKPGPTTPNPNPTTPKPPATPTPTASPTSCSGAKFGQNIPLIGDCAKYITCVGGGIVRKCGPGTHFNAKLQVCDWPERANCKI